jgi:hypothetical protein
MYKNYSNAYFFTDKFLGMCGHISNIYVLKVDYQSASSFPYCYIFLLYNATENHQCTFLFWQGVEWYLYPACGGAVLGPGTCWGTRKWDCRQARKRRLCSKFVGPEPALGVSRQDIRRRIRLWLVNQHWVWWWGLGNTQRQARELISGPCLGAKVRFLSFSRTQSRVIISLLTGHNTL